MPPPPGYGTPTNLLLSSNVLKKVASFSVERSGNSNSNSSNSVSNAQLLATGEEKDKEREKETTLTATTTTTTTSTSTEQQQQQTVAAGAGSRRGSSFVPEKLSFAAYEKFEGKSHQIFFTETLVKRSQREGGVRKLHGLNISLTNDFCAFLFAFLLNSANWRHV